MASERWKGWGPPEPWADPSQVWEGRDAAGAWEDRDPSGARQGRDHSEIVEPVEARETWGSVDPAVFRAACSQFPTGVVVVTAIGPGGRDHGATVNAFASFTLEPPQLLVCLARTSNTYKAIERARAFAVNVLSEGQAEIARLFASKYPDKMSRVRFHRGAVGAALLDGVMGYFECRLADLVVRDDHVIVLGRVVNTCHDTTNQPLVYFRGQMYDRPAPD